VRATTRDQQVFELEDNTWSANNWFERKAVVTNVGIFVFDTKDVKKPPRFWPWRQFNMVAMKKISEKVEGNLTDAKGKALSLTKGNLFVLKDKEDSEVVFAVNQREDMQFFVKAVQEMHKYFLSKSCKLLAGNESLDFSI